MADAEAEPTATSTEVEQVVKAVGAGDIENYRDLLTKLARTRTTEIVPLPAEPPVPATITDKAKAALNRLPKVFGKVVPTTRRMLEDQEVKDLVAERETLDEIEKMAKDRKEAIRTTVFNHLDVEFEAKHADEVGETPREENGHFVVTGEIKVPGVDKRFTREVRSGSVDLTSDDLKALEAEGLITHQDFLDATEPIRYLNENKLMLLLKRKPELVRVIAPRIKTSKTTASFYMRKA